MTTIGTVFVWDALGAVILSMTCYVLSLRGNTKLRLWGRGLFIFAALCVIGTAVVHSTLLMTHRFDVAYVYHYSARQLPRPYLFATFWAGQEGSFLLWAFWTSVLGVILAFKTSRSIESRVMPIYASVLGFLLLLLTVKSPFLPYVPLGPLDPLHPTNGQGLNPLLENPWMVMHPPTLFLGFASLAATFSFALAALIWGSDDDWYRRAWPWALFSFSVLGFGVMLGGYWAYETLGWGGFWGWDPVENGPLVPWLGMTALLHGLQVQRTKGGLKKTNLFLGLFPFVAALYETFLTRTGILDKFSNHSFSTLGGIANSVILYGMVFALTVSVALLWYRRKEVVSKSNAWETASSREFGYTLAIIILIVCAVITGAGMSAPLITQGLVSLHILHFQSSVNTDFYNKANFPIAVLLAAGMGIGPWLVWQRTSGAHLFKLQYTYMAAVIGTVALYLAGWLIGHFRMGAPQLLLFAAALFALISNVQLMIGRVIRQKGEPQLLRTAGGMLAHTGAAFMLLGIVFLVSFWRSDQPVLVQGHSRELENLPYTVAYTGMSNNLKDPANLLLFRVYPRDGQAPFTARMPMAIRNVQGTMKLLARPAIFHKWWGDIYFALKDGPTELSPTVLQRFSLEKGQTREIAGYTFFFNGFYVAPAIAAEAQSGQMPRRFPVSAVLTITGPGHKTAEVRPQYIRDMDDPISNGSPEQIMPSTDKEDPWAVAFTGMDAGFDGGAGSGSFYIRDASIAPVEAYTIEVSTRPGIGLVWLGTVLISLGGLLSLRRRALENRLNPVPDPEPDDRTSEAAPSRGADTDKTSGRKVAPVSMKSIRQ